MGGPLHIMRLYNGKISNWRKNVCIEILKKYRNNPIACINCHSLSTLPICVLLKLYTKSYLIYDTHELETETESENEAEPEDENSEDENADQQTEPEEAS